MTNIRLPRLLNASMQELGRLSPLTLSIEMNLTPLSTAVMTLPPDAPAVETGQFMELYTAQGSAGIFRVEQVERSYPAAPRITLTHGLVTLSDGLLITEADITQPAAQLFRDILSQQSLWQPGSITLPQNALITRRSGSASLLEALTALMQEYPDYYLSFDQSSTPWRLHLLPLSSDCTAECRLTRNLRSLTIETDRSELCTQLYLPGVAEPLQADTITRWGPVSRSLDADAGLTAEEVAQLGARYLEQHKDPLVTVTMDALDLCAATGSTLDSFQLGSLCRVCLPEESLALTQRIVTLSYPDVYATPELIRITLANKVQNASSVLAGLIVDTTQVRKQVVRQWEALNDQKNLIISAEESISLLSRSITLQAEEILTLHAGIGDNAAQIILQDGRIDANANAISLQAKNVLTLEAGVAENKAAIALANGDIALMADDITANANAIALKADQASLDLANGRIDAQANEIALKADLITLDAYVKATTLEANYAKLTDLNSVRASISNLTSGLTTATVINSNVINGSQINTTYLSANSFTHNGAIVSQRSITMGSVTSVGKALSTGGELDLQHSHAVTVNDDGTVTLGEVSAEGGNFKIADTKVYKDGVSAAYGSGYNVGFGDGKDAYLPTAINRTGYSAENKTVTVRALNAHQDLLTGQVIDATEIYNTGWNECRDAMTQISNLYTISQTAPGTLYMLVNGNYTSVGSSWVQVSSYTSAYRRPAAIA